MDKKIIQAFISLFNNSNYNLTYIFKKFPSEIEFQHGQTFLINLKLLMPGPDIDFTLWLKEALGLEFFGGGVTPTILGELYINFGYCGIYAGMFALGAVFSYLDRKITVTKCKSYLIFVILELCLAISGGIANYIIPIILYSIVYLIIDLISTKEYKEVEGENKSDFKKDIQSAI